MSARFTDHDLIMSVDGEEGLSHERRYSVLVAHDGRGFSEVFVWAANMREARLVAVEYLIRIEGRTIGSFHVTQVERLTDLGLADRGWIWDSGPLGAVSPRAGGET